MNLQGTSILGWDRGGDSGPVLFALNATTGEKLEPEFFAANDEEVSQAAQLAAAAFSTYRNWSGQQRAELLRRMAALLEENATVIIERANLETALPPARLQGEMGRTCGQLRLFANVTEEGSWVDARIDPPDPQRKPLPKPDVRSMLRPLGPVAVFGASNFPLAFSVAGGDTASALAAGCPVIVKAHEGHPGTSEMVGLLVQQTARECGAPEGMFSLLQGSGKTVGVSLVRHPLIKAVGFTGSRGAGRSLMNLAAARPEPIPVYAEMGSVNPVFLLKGAVTERREEIAKGLHASVTLGVGQFCTNPGLIFIEKGEAATKFYDVLTPLMKTTAPGPMLTAGILAGYKKELAVFMAVRGVSTLVQVESGANKAGAVLLTCDAKTFMDQPELLNEVFGPATLVVECASGADMEAAARRLDGQLTATIHGTAPDLRDHQDLIGVLETKVGRLVCNGFPTGVEVDHAMQHGGPYPATGDGRTTSVGTRAIERFARPVCFQDFPDEALPKELQSTNPLGLLRLMEGRMEPR